MLIDIDKNKGKMTMSLVLDNNNDGLPEIEIIDSVRSNIKKAYQT